MTLLPQKTKTIVERLEIALLDLALAVEEKRVKGIYQKTGETLYPIKKKKV